MFEVLVALRRECSGNWTIQLVRPVLRSKKQHEFHHLYVPYSKQQFHWLVNGLKFVGLLAGVAKTGSLSQAKAQARLRLKQQLLRSKTEMEIAHIEIPTSNTLLHKE
jgi:hypothetical protein